MLKKPSILFVLFTLSTLVFAKSIKKDFTTGGFIELDKEFTSERNIITKIEKISDNKAYVECSSLVLPASGNSVVGAHTVVVGYYFTVGETYKQGKLVKIGENILTFEYETIYENPIYLFASPEDKKVAFYFYDFESYDWDKLIIETGSKSKEVKRNSTKQNIYSVIFDNLNNGEEYLFTYYVIDKNGEKSEIDYKKATPIIQEIVTKTGFYCNITNITCLERNRTLVFKWQNPEKTDYDSLMAEINGRTYNIDKSATELIVNNLCNSQKYEIKFYCIKGKEISNPIFYSGTPKFKNTISFFVVTTGNKKALLTWLEDSYEDFDNVIISIEKKAGYNKGSWSDDIIIGTYTIPKGTFFYEATGLENGQEYNFYIKLEDNIKKTSEEIENIIYNSKIPSFPNSLSDISTKSSEYSIEISWDNSTKDTYNAVEIISSSGETQTIPYPQNKATFNNLNPNTEYNFSLRMIDEENYKSFPAKVLGFTSIKNNIKNAKIKKNENSVTVTWDESALTPYVYEIKIRDGLHTYKVKKGECKYTIDYPTGGTILLSTVTASGDESYAINVNY
jgi:hypothetical protein